MAQDPAALTGFAGRAAAELNGPTEPSVYQDASNRLLQDLPEEADAAL